MLIFLQLDDSEYTAAAATKAKKTMELEIQDLQQQLDDIFRAKTEARLNSIHFNNRLNKICKLKIFLGHQ